MEDFEPYDCFHQIQMTDETSHSSLVGQQSDAMKKQEDNSSSLVVNPPYFHQRKTNKYDGHPYHLRALQEDNDDDLLLDRLLRSPLLSRREDTRSRNQEQDEPMQGISCCFGRSVSDETLSEYAYNQQEESDIKIIAKNVTPTFKPQQEQEQRKKRKNHFLNPGTHLARTLNFPYKNDDSTTGIGVVSKRLKIWNDEADQGRVLEKHFNPEWQFQFLNEFYGRNDAPLLSSRNNMKTRVINNNYDPSEADLHNIVRRKKKDECNKKRQKKDNEERYYATKQILFDANILKEASLKLLAAMDLSDISRNNIYRIEEEINFDRKKYIL